MKSLTLLCAFFAGTFSLSGQTENHRVVTEQAVAEFVSSHRVVTPGQTFELALEFTLEAHWHLYWINPGASGLGIELEWDLPEGFEAGEIQWPAPERIDFFGLMSYAFEDVVTYLVPIQVSESVEVGQVAEIGVDAFWLVCKDVCLPGEGTFSLSVAVAETAVPQESDLFARARASLPETDVPFEIGAVTEGDRMILQVQGAEDSLPEELYFYAEDPGIVDANAEQILTVIDSERVELNLALMETFMDAPQTQIAGVLQSADRSWQVTLDLGAGFRNVTQVVVSESGAGGFEAYFLDMGLLGWLVLAFLGGLILNVMPCVLPVLSLKVFSLLKHSGQTKRQALLHGLAYTVGVVVSFLILAGVLILLRSFGEQIGWGFQLQSPGFIVVLALIFFLFALNLMGVFELGSSLVGADSSVAKRNDVYGSFAMGVLAAVVGAPCVGPLLASVGGIAVQAQAAVGLLIFGTMGLGLATPFLLLAIFPRCIAYLPKPGPWMESVKQFMGFLLLAAVVFLAMVVGASGGTSGMNALLLTLLISALAAWIYGRWGAPVKPRSTQRIARILSLVLLGLAGYYGVVQVRTAYLENLATEPSTVDGDWGQWSDLRVEAELAEGNPVFVDFTASWCLICQVNKVRALRTDATKELFDTAGVVPLEADWSKYDPAITAALERFDRSGVPLYLLYAPDGSVQVLPQNLNNQIIADAVANMGN